MDSRAKQRLTGAVILAALFVLLVPELLTGPHVADAPESAPTDEGMRRYTIDLDAAAPPAQVDSRSAQSPVSLPAVADGRAQPGEDAAPATPAPAVPTTATAPRTDSPKPLVPSPVAATPVAATPVAPPATQGSFAVQLGTFGSRENADRLVHDMTTKGFAAFVAPFTKGGHELYRVRVGPTRDRSAAEALAAQLRRIGQSGSIVPIS
jgi:DedD protein